MGVSWEEDEWNLLGHEVLREPLAQVERLVLQVQFHELHPGDMRSVGPLTTRSPPSPCTSLPSAASTS